MSFLDTEAEYIEESMLHPTPITQPPGRQQGASMPIAPKKRGTETETLQEDKKSRPKKTRRGQNRRRYRRWQSLSETNPDTQDLTGPWNVLNLSNRTLTLEETSLLSKGLNIFLLRHFNVLDTILDINKFIRNLAIKKHFKEG